MRISRIYLPLEVKTTESPVLVSGEKAHYIRNVLRLKVGQELNFFIPAGIEYRSKVATISKHEVSLSVVERLNDSAPKSSLDTTLVQGISSSDRMDYSIQKAAELGCTRLIPVFSDFCSVKIAEHKRDKKHQHWQAVAIGASEQSGRCDIMQVETIQALSDVVKQTNQGIYLEPTATTHLHQIPEPMQRKLQVFIGPEGGFSPTEIDCFNDQGLLGVQLGQRVLRTETVAPVILSGLHVLFGDFKPPDG